MKRFRDKLIEKKSAFDELTISLPARKLHEIVPNGQYSPDCKHCHECTCFKNDVYDLYHTDKVENVQYQYSMPRAVATCKECHNNYYSPVDFHPPERCHCMYSVYFDKCRKCDKTIIEVDKNDINNSNIVSVAPCTSFAWDWTAAVDRDSSFHYDFGLDTTYLSLLKEEFPNSLVLIIQGYLCLDVEKIKKKILDRENPIDFQATTNGKGKWVISIYEIAPSHYGHKPIRKRTSSWRYDNLDMASVENGLRNLRFL